MYQNVKRAGRLTYSTAGHSPCEHSGQVLQHSTGKNGSRYSSEYASNTSLQQSTDSTNFADCHNMSQSTNNNNLVDNTASGLPELIAEFRHRLKKAGLISLAEGWWLYEDQYCCLHTVSESIDKSDPFVRRRISELARQSIRIGNDLIDRDEVLFYSYPLPSMFASGVSALCCIVLPEKNESVDSPIGRIACGCDKIVSEMSEHTRQKSTEDCTSHNIAEITPMPVHSHDSMHMPVITL